MKNRIRFALACALGHLGLSCLVALASAAVVFFVWYPQPYDELLGVKSIFFLILAVDVTCGPLITLVIANPLKPRKEKVMDFCVIGAIQMAALVYGLHITWAARPVVLAFENDRFTVVAYNEIEQSRMGNAKEAFQKIPLFGLVQVATRKPLSNEEFMSSLELSLGGVSPAMRPDWWEPMEGHQKTIQSLMRPLEQLRAKNAAHADLLNQFARKTGLHLEQLYYLPLTSSKSADWVVVLNQDAQMVGYLPIDGF